MNSYEIVTERIISLLEHGVIPWRRPWSAAGAPRNLVSKQVYGGINFFLLSATKYVSRTGSRSGGRNSAVGSLHMMAVVVASYSHKARTTQNRRGRWLHERVARRLSNARCRITTLRGTAKGWRHGLLGLGCPRGWGRHFWKERRDFFERRSTSRRFRRRNAAAHTKTKIKNPIQY